MSWYVWRRWRFAWAAIRGEALCTGIIDGHGVWTCLYGKLFLLTERR